MRMGLEYFAPAVPEGFVLSPSDAWSDHGFSDKWYIWCTTGAKYSGPYPGTSFRINGCGQHTPLPRCIERIQWRL